MKKQKLLIILPVLLLGLTGWIIGRNQELPQILIAIQSVQFSYLAFAGLLMGCYWLINAGILKTLFHTNPMPLTWKDAIQLTMVGQYYSAITPFASGGQPAQILSMSAKQIPVGRSTSLLMVKFLIYQISVVLYALGFFLWQYQYIRRTLAGGLTWILFGLILNGFLILLIVLALKKRDWLEEKLIRLVAFLSSKKKTFRVDFWNKKIIQSLDEYEKSAKEVQATPKLAGSIFILTLLQLSAYFAVSWAIYRSFGLGQIGIIRILALQSLLYMAISFIPTPGNAGASEGGFLVIFQLLFTGATLMPAMLLWRLITYYFNLMIGGLVTLYDHWECARIQQKKASSLG